VRTRSATSSIVEPRIEAAVWLVVILGLWLGIAHAEELTGKVIRVADGDTLTILDASQAHHTIRLAGIDAPEKSQPYGAEARENLIRLAEGKDARLDCQKTDRYSRKICKVWVWPEDCPTCEMTLDVGLMQVHLGLAWWFREYAREQSERDRRAYEIQLPPGYRFSVAGSSKDIRESMGYAAQALALAVVFIYLILASQFGSFLQPVAIMMSLPMSLIGVILALMLARSTLNIFSIIGFIMLMGLVTKNAILLVDFVNQERKAGRARHGAVLAAGRIRLRPILMTTLAMIFGMFPLALGLGEGAEQRAPMGQAVIGGVITSSLLTLVVVPVIYTYLDDLAGWARRVGGFSAAGAARQPVPPRD
jgi:hypothetical protein